MGLKEDYGEDRQKLQGWAFPIYCGLWLLSLAYFMEYFGVMRRENDTQLTVLFMRYFEYGMFYFVFFFQGFQLDHARLTTTPSSKDVLVALKHSFKLYYIFRPTKENYQKHEKYMIHRMRTGVASYWQSSQVLSLLGVFGTLCALFWKCLNPGPHLYQRWSAENDFMSIYREDFSIYQGLVLAFMAISALGSAIFARIYGRIMGNGSLVKLVRASLRDAREKYGIQGEELWLQWWVNEVSQESERLQDELDSGEFVNAGALTGIIWKAAWVTPKTHPLSNIEKKTAKE